MGGRESTENAPDVLGFVSIGDSEALGVLTMSENADASCNGSHSKRQVRKIILIRTSTMFSASPLPRARLRRLRRAPARVYQSPKRLGL